MKIKCRECGRGMDFGEFMPYIEFYLLKLAVASGLAAFLVETVKNYFSTKQETKGFVDGRMATYANLVEIKCPKCKEIGVWDPISITEYDVIKKRRCVKKTNRGLTSYFSEGE